MNSQQSPQDFLEKSANDYHGKIINGWERLYQKKWKYSYEKLKKFHVPEVALELGCADGIMTQRLCHDFERLTVVDGSEHFLQQIKKNVDFGNLELVHSLFEKYDSPPIFNTIFMSHILEHLDEPVALLKHSLQWLAPHGRVLVIVPNANSLHRLVGVKMGLLPQKDALNKQDILLGHKRVYTPELLRQHIINAGCKIIRLGGIMVKPISNRQIEEQWSDELIDAFLSLGDDMPELCSEIYVVAEKGEDS
ncbi:MAG: class I SAM-dependent methyltransferase [Symploca sp. SIO2B6]|nr:class I SAM-dependent methyltransferase [Symploca sp. SIO2B6]